MARGRARRGDDRSPADRQWLPRGFDRSDPPPSGGPLHHRRAVNTPWPRPFSSETKWSEPPQAYLGGHRERLRPSSRTQEATGGVRGARAPDERRKRPGRCPILGRGASRRTLARWYRRHGPERGGSRPGPAVIVRRAQKNARSMGAYRRRLRIHNANTPTMTTSATTRQDPAAHGQAEQRDPEVIHRHQQVSPRPPALGGRQARGLQCRPREQAPRGLEGRSGRLWRG